MAAQGSEKIVKLLIGAYMASIMLQAMNVMSLMLHGLSVQYPDVPVQQIQMLMTVENLSCIVGMLISGRMASFFTKKTILVFLMCLMGFGGVFGYFSTELWMVYAAAVIIGIADGSFTPMTAALLSEFLEGEKRAWAISIQGLFVNGGAVILNLIGGLLASMFWKNLYFIYVAAFPMALVLLWLLPNGGIKEVPEKGEKAPVFTRFLSSFLFTAFFNGLAFMTLLSNVAMFVFEAGIGDEVQAGLIQSCATLGAVILGAVFVVPLMKALKRNHWAISLALGTIGLWIMSAASSLPMSLVGGFLIGSCFSMHNTACLSIVPANVHPARTSISMSLIMISMNIGCMLSPILITSIAAAFSATVSMRFTIAAIALTAATVVAFVLPRTVMKDCRLTLQEAEGAEASSNQREIGEQA